MLKYDVKSMNKSTQFLAPIAGSGSPGKKKTEINSQKVQQDEILESHNTNSNK